MAESSALRRYTEPVRVSYTNPTFFNGSAEREAASQENVWHKFILFNIKPEEKVLLLDALLLFCSPTLLFPVMYKMETESKATFLMSCSSDIIQKLIEKKLQLRLSTGKFISYDIVLAFLSIKDMNLNPLDIITEVLKMRCFKEGNRRVLNLNNFENDRKLRSVYCPLKVPVIFETILLLCKKLFATNNLSMNMARDNKLPFQILNLKSNRLQGINLIAKNYFNYHLCKLDVRNNELRDLRAISTFSEFKITDLWLDENPLCDKYNTCKEYTEDAKKVFPNLQMLDGVIIGSEKSLPLHHKHFIVNQANKSLAQQFIKHFFTLYDQDDRIVMNGLYDAGALFSMSVGAIHNPLHKQIMKTFAINRNLLKCSDYAKSTELLLNGPEKIISALRHQPLTIHKFKLMEIDVIFSSSNCFVVSIQGPFMFKKCSIQPLWFNRTLIVVAKEDNEYCITNDQYHIDNVSVSYSINQIDDLRSSIENSIPTFTPKTFSSAEKKQLVKLLEELTTMNMQSSLKFLKETNWDVRSAINEFMNQYVANKIPEDAFRNCDYM